MRIICPNCQAQYEVPDDVIPRDGRDVQCSNCSKTWFILHPASRPEDPSPPPAAEGEKIVRPVKNSDKVNGQAAQPKPRRKLDATVEEILRQEAERETAARAAEAQALEVQEELALEAPPAPAPQPEKTPPQEPQDKNKGNRHVAAAKAKAAAPQRRELLPDLAEINSSLRTSDTPSKDAEQDKTDSKPHSGSLLGFSLALILCAAALAIYTYAPELAQTAPQLDPWLSQYVSWIDTGRYWLDEQVRHGLTWLDSVVESAAQPETEAPEN